MKSMKSFYDLPPRPVNTKSNQEFPQKIPVTEEHSLGFAGKAAPQRAIHAIYGSVAVEKAPHLHADPCQTRVPAVEVAQVHVVSHLPLQNLDVHFSICEILGFILLHSCHRQLFGGTPGKATNGMNGELTRWGRAEIVITKANPL